jgi:subtilase family serine protease
MPGHCPDVTLTNRRSAVRRSVDRRRRRVVRVRHVASPSGSAFSKSGYLGAAMHRALKRALLASTTATALLPAAAAVPAHAARPGRATIEGSAPGWVQPARDHGAADASQTIDVKVYLPLRDPAAAAAQVRDVADPSSPDYGKYLSPADFRSRYAPLPADVAAVSQFLTDAGLTVGAIPDNHHSVTASGTLAQVEKAFAVDVHQYAYRGRLLRAPTSQLSVPAALAGKVVAVSGVDQSGTLIRPAAVGGREDGATLPAPDAPVTQNPAAAPPKSLSKVAPGAPPPAAFVNAPPCSTYYGEKIATTLPPAWGKKQPYAPCGYTPSQFQGAYGVDQAVKKGIDGRGITVAITDAYAAPTILQDANTYAKAHGQQAFGKDQFSQLLPASYTDGYDEYGPDNPCDEQGWYGEETLDVEAVHAVAPGAKVTYVGAASCNDADFDDALNKIVDNKLATIVSNSWGGLGEDEPTDLATAYQATFVQAALEGIGIFFSSGDNGDESANELNPTGGPLVDFPSSDPFVTAVGGTALAVGAKNDYQWEVGWASGTSSLSPNGKKWKPAPPGDWLYGAGGGVSQVFDEPYYQQGVVPDSIAQGKRATPDIAMDADPQTGMLVGETQTFPDGSAKYSEYRIGGTSLASPLYAAVEAIADQVYGRAHGFVNPAIYALNGTKAVHDVVPRGNNAVVRVNYNNGVDATDGTTPILRSLDDEAQSIHTGPKWDTITGVGTPNGLSYLLSLGPAKSPAG